MRAGRSPLSFVPASNRSVKSAPWIRIDSPVPTSSMWTRHVPAAGASCGMSSAVITRAYVIVGGGCAVGGSCCPIGGWGFGVVGFAGDGQPASTARAAARTIPFVMPPMLRLGGELHQRVAGHSLDPPRIHPDRAERAVEADRVDV